MYQHHDGYWQPFDPPFHEVSDHKADVLHHVAQHRAAWLPQLAARAGGAAAVGPLRPEAVLLVDDERANFRHYKGDGAVTEALRCCKVPRYDDLYRDCGPLNQLGGLGAHSDADYDSVRRFVEEPWEFPSLDTQLSFVAADLSDNHVVAVESEELALLPRERGPKTLFGRRAPVRRPTRGSSGLLGPAACSLAGCLRWARGVCAAGCGALAP
ncbi:unnamed protein product [Prorocentrum cordatum]|uniref:Uncharacterized protein n=1 Tax=Prorocentrum cordatum TaxID=2364126 RepID=A0ABN9VPC3_9DINO|nr:unnamed protein product [Polarella glacialis]